MDPFRNVLFGAFGGMHHQGLSFYKWPLYCSFRAIYFEALAVLSGDVEERPVNLGAEIGVSELDMRSFDSKGRVVMLLQFRTDSAGAETRNIFRFRACKSQYGANAMRGVMHRRKPRPIVRPAVHVLLMAGLQKLEFPQLTFVIEDRKSTRLNSSHMS